MTKPDQELWAAAAAGDEDAFGALFDRYAKAVYNHCFRLIGVATGDLPAAEREALALCVVSVPALNGTYLVRIPRRGTVKTSEVSETPITPIVLTVFDARGSVPGSAWRQKLRHGNPLGLSAPGRTPDHEKMLLSAGG